jgi:hypothetical protein
VARPIPLPMAVMRKNLALTLRLLEAKANPSLVEEGCRGEFPLHSIVVYDYDDATAEIAKQLINHGANPLA